jgi:hypothetical protein
MFGDRGRTRIDAVPLYANANVADRRSHGCEAVAAQ